MFEKADIKHWRKTVHKELRRASLDEAREPVVYRTAMIAATVYCFGTDPAILRELTSYDLAFVRDTLKRLRAAKILVGQKLRVRWNDDGAAGRVALMLDAMTAAGDLVRPVDERRSRAQKGKTRQSGGTRRRGPVARGVFTPAVAKCDPYYGLPEWGRTHRRQSTQPHSPPSNH